MCVNHFRANIGYSINFCIEGARGKMERTSWDLSVGESGEITELVAKDTIRRRLQDLGFVEGANIRKILSAKAIAAYQVRGTVIAVREHDAKSVGVAWG